MRTALYVDPGPIFIDRLRAGQQPDDQEQETQEEADAGQEEPNDPEDERGADDDVQQRFDVEEDVEATPSLCANTDLASAVPSPNRPCRTRRLNNCDGDTHHRDTATPPRARGIPDQSQRPAVHEQQAPRHEREQKYQYDAGGAVRRVVEEEDADEDEEAEAREEGQQHGDAAPGVAGIAAAEGGEGGVVALRGGWG